MEPKTNYWVIPAIVKVRKITVTEFIAAYCDVQGVSVEMVMRNTNKRETVIHRQLLMYLININFKNMLLERIGEIFGRDYSTVIYSRKTVIDKIRCGKSYAKMLQQLLGPLSLKLGQEVSI